MLSAFNAKSSGFFVLVAKLLGDIFLFSWLDYLTYSTIHLLGHLFGTVAKQAAGVCQFDFAGCLRSDVFELELADQNC